MTGLDENSVRADILGCFQMALQAVNGRACVRAYLEQQTDRPRQQLALVAIGKAAVAMAEGALDVLGPQISTGLVITKVGYGGDGFCHHPQIELIESAHPVPDARSLAAGQRLLGFLQGLAADRPLLFLISGGSSALVEVLAEGIELVDLQRMNSQLLAAGLPIDAMNRVRRAVSLIKGGRLLNYMGDRRVMNLLLSDVPDNDPAVIGSGLLINPGPALSLPPDLPAAIHDTLSKRKPSDATINAQATVETVILADNHRACEAAADCARQKHYPVEVHAEFLSADVADVAAHIIDSLNKAKPGMHIWGGEATVCLPDKPGRGGRNQHLALLLAQRIRQRDGLHILVAATDGSDGPGEDAGGLVDARTAVRGEQAGFSVESCLGAADAGRFLAASGDLISTGPTGSNVMDLIIACKT